MANLTGQALINLAAQAGFQPGDHIIAAKIAVAESSGNPLATHTNTDSRKTTDYGLWQINSYWHAKELATGDWKVPADNAKMALSVYNSGGWNQWSAYKTGAYKNQNLTDVNAAGSLAGGLGIADPTTGQAPDIAGSITSAVNGLTSQFSKMAGQGVSIAVALALLAIGVLLLLAKPAAALAVVATPAGKVASLAGSAAAAATTGPGHVGSHRA